MPMYLARSFQSSLSLLQIISGEIIENSINFGQSQKPKLKNYADDIDTINFLLKI